jgi:putative pyrroloquinoline-quinone binding quinoprotein
MLLQVLFGVTFAALIATVVVVGVNHAPSGGGSTTTSAPTPAPACNPTFKQVVQQEETNNDNFALLGQIIVHHPSTDALVTVHKNETQGFEVISKDRSLWTRNWRRADYCTTGSAHLQLQTDTTTGDVYFAYSCLHNLTIDKYNGTDGTLLWRTENNIQLNPITVQLPWINAPLTVGARVVAAIRLYNTSAYGQVCSLDSTDGTVQWCTVFVQSDLIVTADPATDDFVYVAVVATDTIYQLDITTGVQTGWTTTVDSSERIVSMTAVGDAVFVTCKDTANAQVHKLTPFTSPPVEWTTVVQADRVTYDGTSGSEAINVIYDATNALLLVVGDHYALPQGKYRPWFATMDPATGAVLSYVEDVYVADLDIKRVGATADVGHRALYYTYQRYDYDASSFTYKVKDFCY